MKAIEVQQLSKNYGQVKALDAISFEVEQGEIFGLIGPDGAGKTSLFRLLTTLLLPDNGRAKVTGFDIVKELWEIRKIVGYMPGKFSLYQDLSIEENLNFFATVFNTTVEKNYHLIEEIYVQIEPFKKRRAGKLSGGMKQKLALCCALIHEPKVLFLDEPTTGVDPVSRNEFWDMLDRLKEKGITIVVSTPYMDEAARCDHIALINQGKILKIETLEHIIQGYQAPLFAAKSDKMYQLLKDLRNYENAQAAFAFGEKHHVTIVNKELEPENLMQYLRSKNHQNIQLHPISAGIEDVFIELIG